MKILIIEDDKNQLKILSKFFKDNGFKVFSASNGEEGIKTFNEHNIEIVISDYRMPGLTGKDVLKKILLINPNTPFILITAYSSIKDAVEMVKMGAFDYIEKPINLKYLLRKVNNAKRFLTTRDTKQQTIKRLKQEEFDQDYVFHSEAMTKILKTTNKIAHTDVTVLLTGESGTGKEVIAKIIHKLGPRKNNNFVAVNCAAIPENLIESELFGHTKGAFTGATSNKIGRFELADKGTLFLDEIGDIPLSIQVKLLRALENMEFQPVGSPETKKVDVRLISATNQNLKTSIKEGNFRKDLFYRLNVIPIHLPPLRERKADIPKLIQYYLNSGHEKNKFNITDKAIDKLISYDWPGNIRELRNVIRRITALASKDNITESELPEEINKSVDKNSDLNNPKKLETMEKKHIKKIIKKCDGNQVKAAKILGIHRNTLRRKLRKYDLE